MPLPHSISGSYSEQTPFLTTEPAVLSPNHHFSPDQIQNQLAYTNNQDQSFARVPRTSSFDLLPPAQNSIQPFLSTEPESFDDRATMPPNRNMASAETTIDSSQARDSSQSIPQVDGTEVQADTDAPASDIAPLAPPKAKAKTTRKHTEGMDSDKRYLCYLCNKLFTRRRSVKDHINKIHPGHTFEGEKSLEIIVDPGTNEPVDPDSIPPLPPGYTPAPEAPKARSEKSAAASPTSTKRPTLKTEPSFSSSRASSAELFPTPAPVAGQKRPADFDAPPKPATIKKKGTAGTVKHTSTPVHKKVKTSESESINVTPVFRSPSGTPASSRPSKPPPKIIKKPSPASVASSPAPSESRLSVGSPDEDAYTPNTNDDGEVFCICRRGDNHTWMIACDGACEDWFHGKCVGIAERDGELIDKYICPNCQREGYQTTWKRMCRRKACRKPAKVTDDPPSKYCSQECGRMFFVEMIQRSDADACASPTGQHVIDPVRQKKYRKKPKQYKKKAIEDEDYMDMDQENNDSPYASPPASNGHVKHDYAQRNGHKDDSATEYETDTSTDDEILPSRGGALRAGEISALAQNYNTIDLWREKMGERPARDASNVETMTEFQYSVLEQSQLNLIASKMTALHQQNDELKAKEAFLELVKKYSATVTDKVREKYPKQKETCGFDKRLSCADDEFRAWKKSPAGKAAFSTGKLGPPGQSRGDDDMSESDDEERAIGATPTLGGICIKNRCARHGKWQKVQLAEIRFEMDRIAKSIDGLEREEAGVKERAVMRVWEEDVAA